MHSLGASRRVHAQRRLSHPVPQRISTRRTFQEHQCDYDHNKMSSLHSRHALFYDLTAKAGGNGSSEFGASNTLSTHPQTNHSRHRTDFRLQGQTQQATTLCRPIATMRILPLRTTYSVRDMLRMIPHPHRHRQPPSSHSTSWTAYLGAEATSP